MKHTIITYPDKRLKKQSNIITSFNQELIELSKTLRQTMIEEEGVGLAAIQLGIAKRVIAVRAEHGQEIFVNPQIISFSKATECDIEACLSIPAVTAVVPRSVRIKIRAQDIHGRKIRLDATGFLARVFQHEIDHTNGILFIDRAKKIVNAPKNFVLAKNE